MGRCFDVRYQLMCENSPLTPKRCDCTTEQELGRGFCQGDEWYDVDVQTET